MTTSTKPRRPFGVILALAGGVFIFSFIPALMIAIFVYLTRYVQVDASGGMSGLDFKDVTYQPLLIPGIGALIYLLLAIWAWRGKSPVARFVFPLMTALYCIVTWGLLTIPNTDANQGIDSATGFAAIASQIYLFAMIGVTVYIAWFMNRWSARAFFRGYYTKNDLQMLQAVRVTSGD